MPEHDVSQLDLDYAIEKPDWMALKILTEEIQEELAQNRRNLLYCLANWFTALTIFKRFEERHMVLSEPTPRDRSYHRLSLTGVLASGEKLLHELASHRDVDTKNIGIEFQDLRSAVEELRLAYAEWFSDMKPERKEAILQEAFDVQEQRIGADS